ncbi:hypothetical protein M407DRAFT_242111 [Tulasnella calospora MUT 4182]|uniref:Uncharacterized protein n=1 Tax=Tulasnella calospora MUT 4182 TaxID=1051891 RepID=A0A0C3QQG4_9AGAM|nr:hypothetical protein M407DRAFT_242111 [Tulasnella calospora MUT 4182]
MYAGLMEDTRSEACHPPLMRSVAGVLVREKVKGIRPLRKKKKSQNFLGTGNLMEYGRSRAWQYHVSK